jgi:hypothetical protein
MIDPRDHSLPLPICGEYRPNNLTAKFLSAVAPFGYIASAVTVSKVVAAHLFPQICKRPNYTRPHFVFSRLFFTWR